MAEARGLMMVGGNVEAAAGGGEPEAGTILLGTQGSTGSLFCDGSGANYEVTGPAMTASWAASDGTATLASLKTYGAGGGTGNAKLILRNSSRQIVAQTNEVAFTTGNPDGTITFTFASAPTITKGATYYITYINDGTGFCPYFSGTTQDVLYDTTGTYASPIATMTLNDLNDDHNFFFWGVH